MTTPPSSPGIPARALLERLPGGICPASEVQKHATPAPPGNTAASRQKRSKMRSKDRRNAQRTARQAASLSSLKAVSKKRRNNAHAIRVGYDAVSLPATATGWLGLRQPSERNDYSAAELLANPEKFGLTLVRWEDG